MQTFLLACYICLQLTNLPGLDQYTLLKRDNSCDQCLTGMFEQSELYPYVGTESKQTTGGLLESNRPLKQALEERLLLELSRSAVKSKVAQKEETVQQTSLQDQVSKAKVMVEDAVRAGEIAMRTTQEKVIQDIKRKTEEVTVQLQQQQAQLARELELQGARQRDILTKEMEAMRQEITSFARKESQRGSGGMDAFLKSYFEFLGGIMGEAQSVLNKMTPRDWENMLNEVKSVLNGITSQDITKIMKDVQSLMTGSTPQDFENLMKEMLNQERPKANIPNPTIFPNGIPKEYEDLLKELLNEEQPKAKVENPAKEMFNQEPPLTKFPNRNVLQNEVRFRMGESLISENGRYKMKLQNDATLVIIDQYQHDRIVKMISSTSGVIGRDYHLIMQDDGNLVIYSEVKNGKGVNPTWSTGTNSHDGRTFYLKLEDNGKLVMYNNRGKEIWTSGKVDARPGWKHNMHDL